jgi:hypothetical protein
MSILRLFLSLLLLGGVAQNLAAQAIASGSFSYQWVNMPRLNTIMDSFNLRENHQLTPVTSLSGYHFTLGTVQQFALVEFGFANSARRIRSFTPNQLRETTEVIANFMSATMHVGLRPIPYQYFFVGIGFNFGVKRLRYSYGGDYIEPVRLYNIAPEIFVDYSIKIKFLLKQNLRRQTFYMLRIRPFYQVHFPTNIGRMEQSLNENPAASASDARYDEAWSNFGIRIGLVVPISKIPPKDLTPKAKKVPKLSKKERREKFKLQH